MMNFILIISLLQIAVAQQDPLNFDPTQLDSSVPQVAPGNFDPNNNFNTDPAQQIDQFPVNSGVDPLMEDFIEILTYSPEGRRDPFLPFTALQRAIRISERVQEPLEPLQQFNLTDLQIVGIIWDVGKPKALVVDPQGKSHIITESAKLGNSFGYVAAIREGEVIVVEESIDSMGVKTFVTKILKINPKAAVNSAAM